MLRISMGIIILVLSVNVDAVECSMIKDAHERLSCYDTVTKVQSEAAQADVNHTQVDDRFLNARGKVKAFLKDPGSSQFKNEFVSTNSQGVETICGEVNAKNGFGGYNGFRKYFVSDKTVRLAGIDMDMDPTIWDMNCNDKVQTYKLGDWQQFYSGENTVFSINGDNSTLLMKCYLNTVAMINDFSYKVDPEKSRGLFGNGPLVETGTTALRINGHGSHWEIVDENTIRFLMRRRNMRHIANMVNSSEIVIGPNKYSVTGFKESLIELRKICGGRSWNKHINKYLDN